MFSMQRTAEGNVPAEARIDAQLLKDLLDFVEDGVCLLDCNDRVLYWNHGAEQITGYLAQEVSGRGASRHPASCDHSGGTCLVAKVKADGEPREEISFLDHKRGHRVPVRMRAHAIWDANGGIAGVAQVFARASAQGRTELAEAARHRGHDGLTGAVNREYGEMRLRQELEAVKRFGLAAAWMRVEIDHVGDLRHRFGNAMVDAVMRMVAHTIDANLQSYDALVLWDQTSFRVMVRHAVEPHVTELARRLELLVSTSQVKWWGESHSVSVSIASVMVKPEDSLASLEERAAYAIAASCLGKELL
jgi:diguanylate cyclase (GGDEF)-like protein/PAS domain S-box-containing protein